MASLLRLRPTYLSSKHGASNPLAGICADSVLGWFTTATTSPPTAIQNGKLSSRMPITLSHASCSRMHKLRHRMRKSLGLSRTSSNSCLLLAIGLQANEPFNRSIGSRSGRTVLGVRNAIWPAIAGHIVGTGDLLLRLVAFDQRIGTVVVDGFEVLRFHHIGIDQRLGVHRCCDVAHDVLDEFRIVVGALGDVLFIGTF